MLHSAKSGNLFSAGGNLFSPYLSILTYFHPSTSLFRRDMGRSYLNEPYIERCLPSELRYLHKVATKETENLGVRTRGDAPGLTVVWTYELVTVILLGGSDKLTGGRSLLALRCIRQG